MRTQSSRSDFDIHWQWNCESDKTLRTESLGSVFGRTDFSRFFLGGAAGFFADFVAGFFLLIFESVGKSAQKNPPGKSPAKFTPEKSPTHFCGGAGRTELDSFCELKALWVAICQSSKLGLKAFKEASKTSHEMSEESLSKGSMSWWTFRIFFIFFWYGEGKGEFRGAGKGRGSVFYWKSQEAGGGAPTREGGRGAVRGNWGGGGELNIFFRGRNAHQDVHERKRHININKFFLWLPGGGGGSPDRVGGGSPDREARGQKFMCCVRNPRNINIFVRVPGREESGSRPGGSVTGVTEKLFMCQMFMCLFRPLNYV